MPGDTGKVPFPSSWLLSFFPWSLYQRSLPSHLLSLSSSLDTLVPPRRTPITSGRSPGLRTLFTRLPRHRRPPGEELRMGVVLRNPQPNARKYDPGVYAAPTHRNIRLIPNSNPGQQGAFSWDLLRAPQQVTRSAAPRRDIRWCVSCHNRYCDRVSRFFCLLSALSRPMLYLPSQPPIWPSLRPNTLSGLPSPSSP